MPVARLALCVYVARHCPSCGEAVRVARAAGARFADVGVEVVDLDAPGVTAPPEVFATPTYVLDGRVVVLGNPTVEELSRRLAQHVGPVGAPSAGDGTREVS